METLHGKILPIDTIQGDDLKWFFEGFRLLTKPEQHVLSFLLSQPDYRYHGTFRDMVRSIGLNLNYCPDINRACYQLEGIGILVVEQPTTWYNRNIYLKDNWLEIFLKFGKGSHK